MNPKILLIFLFSILTIVLGTSQRLLDNHRIVGGVEATISEHPYQVSIHINANVPTIGFLSGHQCGGVIISELHVLTAGHCYFPTLDLDSYDVYVGFTKQTERDPTRLHKIESMVAHPKFADRGNETFYDISVITLTTKIQFDINARSIALPEDGFYPVADTDAVVTGWGRLWSHEVLLRIWSKGPPSNELRMLKLKVTDYLDCFTKYHEKHQTIGTEMVCAGGVKGEDSCFGDSGGPLVADGKLIGLVAFGDSKYCALDGIPGVYTNIGSVRDFIREQTNI